MRVGLLAGSLAVTSHQSGQPANIEQHVCSAFRLCGLVQEWEQPTPGQGALGEVVQRLRDGDRDGECVVEQSQDIENLGARDERPLDSGDIALIIEGVEERHTTRGQVRHVTQIECERLFREDQSADLLGESIEVVVIDGT